MEAAQALADLTEISSQIESAVIVDQAGTIAGATLADGSRLAEAGRALLQKAEDVHGSRPAQLEAATAGGSVFVLGDGARTIVATTGPQPTVGLVFYDLKSCLREVEPPRPSRRRAGQPKKAKADGEA